MMFSRVYSFEQAINLLDTTCSLMADSRQLKAGDIFVALPGISSHGLDYLNQALAMRPSAILVDADDGLAGQIEVDYIAEKNCSLIAVKNLACNLGEFAHLFYQNLPTLFAVTGTDGKSSISHYITQILTLLSESCAVIGTLGYGAPDSLLPVINTTPDTLTLHKIGRDFKRQGYPYMALEASSHALDQQRLSGLTIDTAILSNLGRDHLDYHGTVANYGQAKAKLFKWPNLRAAVINQDDPFGRGLLRETTAEKVIPYGCFAAGINALYASDINFSPASIEFTLNYQGEKAVVSVPLIGKFNVYNVLAAAATVLLQGYDFRSIAAVLNQLKPVPGRAESFVAMNGATVIVDYAHTPLALESVLKSVRQQTQGQLICVFGCGGDRDQGKRPLMAASAEKYADQLILTDDNPRNEEPEFIVNQMRNGLSPQANYSVVHDRLKAISQAITLASSGDVVLIAGKGHEETQIIRGASHPFSDREAVMACLNLDAEE